uniref:Uncharacterized protein n=1 Tax=Arundo donax TaxID=35708 RepID=A0A0A9D5I4_ARUDO
MVHYNVLFLLGTVTCESTYTTLRFHHQKRSEKTQIEKPGSKIAFQTSWRSISSHNNCPRKLPEYISTSPNWCPDQDLVGQHMLLQSPDYMYTWSWQPAIRSHSAYFHSNKLSADSK